MVTITISAIVEGTAMAIRADESHGVIVLLAVGFDFGFGFG